MLATLTERAPSGGGWIYEPKLDGVRVLAYVTGGSVRLFSRNRRQVEGGYPELVEALSARGAGRCRARRRDRGAGPATGLSSLRAAAAADAPPRHGAGHRGPASRSSCTCSTACSTRASISPACRCSTGRRCCATWCGTTARSASRPIRTTGSAAMYRDACAKGAEGIIAKRAESPVRERPVHRLAQDQVRASAGARDRRLHRAPGLPRAPRRAAGRLLRRRGRAPVRGQGRHRLRPGDAGDAHDAGSHRCTAAPLPSRPGRSPRARSSG